MMSPARLGSMILSLAWLPSRQTRCSSDASSGTPTNRWKVIFGSSQKRATHLFEGGTQTFAKVGEVQVFVSSARTAQGLQAEASGTAYRATPSYGCPNSNWPYAGYCYKFCYDGRAYSLRGSNQL
jgi:hypothetical protein